MGRAGRILAFLARPGSAPAMKLTPILVPEIFDYNSLTGTLRWLSRPVRPWPSSGADRGWNTRCAGTLAGRPDRNGHLRIHIERLGKPFISYSAHVLGWAHYYGEWPVSFIDHKNGVPSDNRIANLRLCTQAQNMANSRRRKDNQSGYKGVSWLKKQKKWRAYITNNNFIMPLGTFERLEDAVAARREAAFRLRGEFARED